MASRLIRRRQPSRLAVIKCSSLAFSIEHLRTSDTISIKYLDCCPQPCALAPLPRSSSPPWPAPRWRACVAGGRSHSRPPRPARRPPAGRAAAPARAAAAAAARSTSTSCPRRKATGEGFFRHYRRLEQHCKEILQASLYSSFSPKKSVNFFFL